MSAAIPTGRPAWLVSGVRAVDLVQGRVGTVLAVGRPFSVVGPRTATLVPDGGGEPWEAEIGDLRQAGQKAGR